MANSLGEASNDNWNDPVGLTLFLDYFLPYHHPLAPLSVMPKVFHSKLKCHLFKNSYPDSSDPLSSHSPLNYTHLNSYSASSGKRTKISHGLSSDLTQVPRAFWFLSGALKFGDYDSGKCV